MNSIERIFPESITQSLGWSLVHSLWQGVVIAVILGLVLIALRKQSAKMRYFMASTALFSYFGIWLFTFISLYASPLSTTVETSPQINVVTADGFYQNISVSSNHPESFTGEIGNQLTFFSDYFAQHLPLIVLLWMMGVVVLMLRFLGEFTYVQHLKSYRVIPTDRHIQEVGDTLCNKLYINKSVKILESVMTKVPMVIGFLKPVILIPVGAFTGMKPKEIESIIAHELAHVYRNDYLINLFQSVVEVLLFFNPATWWISAQIRAERENCCDDIAVNITGDELAFVKTLALMEERRMQVQTPNLAVAFTGKGGLMSRVKRIANKERKNATFFEGFLAAFIMMLFIVTASFTSQDNPEEAFSDTIESAAIIPLTTEDTPKVLPEVKEATPVNEPSQKPRPIIRNKHLEIINDTIKINGDVYVVDEKDGKTILLKNGEEIETDLLKIFKDGEEISLEEYRNKKDGGTYFITFAEDDTDAVKASGYSYSTTNNSSFSYATSGQGSITSVSGYPSIPPMDSSKIIAQSVYPYVSSIDSIRVRGIYTTSDNKQPLFVIDGKVIDSKDEAFGNGLTINALDPSDIASVTVLKDKSATSIYGSKGKNGVVMITTKKGKKKKGKKGAVSIISGTGSSNSSAYSISSSSGTNSQSMSISSSGEELIVIEDNGTVKFYKNGKEQTIDLKNKSTGFVSFSDGDGEMLVLKPDNADGGLILFQNYKDGDEKNNIVVSNQSFFYMDETKGGESALIRGNREGKITSLIIDKEEIPESDWDEYQNVIDTFKEKVEAKEVIRNNKREEALDEIYDALKKDDIVRKNQETYGDMLTASMTDTGLTVNGMTIPEGRTNKYLDLLEDVGIRLKKSDRKTKILYFR